MATLRAKKPKLKPVRFKSLIYADTGVGKTAFCCSFPDAYYIDSEKLEDYPKFVKMILKNNGHLVYLTALSEIIEEVTALLTEKHAYKTVIIDGITFPYTLLSNIEVERLKKTSKKEIEGTEFSAHTALAARLTFQLGMLLNRLDMNVIVTAHESSKWTHGEEAGKKADVHKRLGHALGTILRMELHGDKRKLFVEKTRYEELPDRQWIDFDNGFEVIQSRFGESIFKNEVTPEEFATAEQIAQFNHFISILNIDDSVVQKTLTGGKATAIHELSKVYIQKCIDKLKDKLNQPSWAA